MSLRSKFVLPVIIFVTIVITLSIGFSYRKSISTIEDIFINQVEDLLKTTESDLNIIPDSISGKNDPVFLKLSEKINLIKSSLPKTIDTIKNQFIIFGLFTVIIIGFGIWAITEKLIITPLFKISEFIKKINKDDKAINTDFNILRNDEIGLLASSIASMPRKLNKILEKLKFEVIKRKRAEEALIFEKDNSTGIINNSPNIISEISIDGIATFINQAGEKITGYSVDHILGSNWWEIICPYGQYHKYYLHLISFQHVRYLLR